MSTQIENGRVHIQSLTPQLKFYLPSSTLSLSRKLGTQILFFFFIPLIKTQEHVHKRKPKKNPLSQRDLNQFFFTHLNPLCYSEFFLIKLFGLSCEEFPDESLLLISRHVPNISKSSVTVYAKICESLIHKKEICFSTPRTEIQHCLM